MAPGAKWKSSVNEVNTNVDRVRKHLDTLIKMEDRKKQIYNNGNTKVEVLVKTKKPNQDWSSILSETDEKPKKVKKKTKKISHDTVDSTLPSSKNHRFSQRTLQIFLREMRLALKHENPGQLYKILDDLEYVAANLSEHENLNSSDKGNDKIDVAFFKTEAKKAKEDCALLKRTVHKLEKKIEIAESEDRAKNQQIAELKNAISKLSSNSNEMLNVLSAKADIEDKQKSIERALNKTQQELSAERFKNSQLELKNKASQMEIEKLKSIIG